MPLCGCITIYLIIARIPEDDDDEDEEEDEEEDEGESSQDDNVYRTTLSTLCKPSNPSCARKKRGGSP